jgi:hypothetical protein
MHGTGYCTQRSNIIIFVSFFLDFFTFKTSSKMHIQLQQLLGIWKLLPFASRSGPIQRALTDLETPSGDELLCWFRDKAGLQRISIRSSGKKVIYSSNIQAFSMHRVGSELPNDPNQLLEGILNFHNPAQYSYRRTLAYRVAIPEISGRRSVSTVRSR